MAVTYRFESFELDPEGRELRRDGTPVSLQDLPLRLLVELVERAPELVSREQLRDALWPPGTHLDVDASLNTAVARAREALGDDAGVPRFLTTVPRRGYRFVAPVERLDTATPATKGPSRHWWAAGVAAIAIPFAIWMLVKNDDVSPEPPGGGLVGGTAAAAREELLIARHHADRRSREGLEKSIAAYQSALALEPESAEAYSGLAFSYGLLGIYDFWRPREAFGPAETMARRALALDPDSARAQLARSLVAAVGGWDWATALDASERARDLSPTDPEVWFWRGSLLSALTRHDEAIEATGRALELDPTSPTINTALAWYLFRARRDEETIAQAHRAIELFPGYYDAWDNLKWIQLTLGNEAEALDAWIRAEELDTGNGQGVRDAYAAGGLPNLHRESIKKKTAHWESGRYQSPFDIALEHAALGEVDDALVWLDRSFAERETDLVDLAVDPRLDPLRSSPRFAELLSRLALPEPPDGD